MTAGIAAITGGTGFVGRHCAIALAQAGWRVRLLARRDPAHPLLAHTPFELVTGDLDDEAALARLVQGARAVVHAAGATKAGSAAAFLAVNRDGSGRLAAIAARRAPSCRFVLVSSQAARCPALSAYAASKRAGEVAARAALGDTACLVLRPAIVYGPWDGASAALLRLANAALVPVPVAPEPRLAMVHVRDAAAAVVAACAPGPSGQTYEIADAAPEGHAWRDIIAASRRPGRPPRFVPVPDRVLAAAGAAADGWSALTRRPARFGLGKAREILHRDWRPDPSLMPPDTLWTPGIELAHGMRETLAWFFSPDGAGRAHSG